MNSNANRSTYHLTGNEGSGLTLFLGVDNKLCLVNDVV
jgi:hypothetical protein